MQIKVKFNDINVKEEKEKTLVKILMLKGEKGDSVSAEWGTITGNLEDQTDLKNALASKANQSSLDTTNQNVSNLQTAVNSKASQNDLNITNQNVSEVNAKTEKKPYYYNTLNDLKTDLDLKDGDCAITLGYYSANDGGAGEYEIITDNTLVDDGGSIINLQNGLKAKLIIKNKVCFRQFGAKGDGTTNDYQSVKNCCDYANANNLLINNLIGNYYVNGNQIILSTSVKNTDSVTFILGENYERYNSLFIFEHDEVNNVENVALSTVFNNKNTLNDNYVGKSFILDTKIKYGQRLDGPDTSNTILEPFYTTKNKEYLWSINYDENLVVNVKNISNSFEKGYTFDGGRIEQSNTSNYGVSFITVSRNNCIIKNLDISCENVNGSNAVLHIDNGNNIILENIHCNSIRPSTGSYNISIENASNIITKNITGNNSSNTFGNRTVKNWLLSNSKVSVWDIHWNSFGFLTIDNTHINGSINIGYGSGILNVKNSYCGGFLQTNQNYSPIFNGEIIVENSYLTDGVHIKRTYTNDELRDAFFDNVILPNVTITNSIKKYINTLQDLYIDIPSEVANLISNKGKILLDNVDLTRIYYSQNSSATQEIYDSVIRDCKNLTSTILNVLNKLGICVCSGSNTNTIENAITPNSVFNNDFTSVCKRNGNDVSIRCEGTLNKNITGTNYKLADIINNLKPNKYSYGIITYDEYVLPCYLNTAGSIFTKGNISSGTKIVITVNYILN